LTERLLIISPQAGLGNRLRAMAAAMVLARQTGRRCLHWWVPTLANDPRPNVKALQQIGFDALFEPCAALPPARPEDMRALSACFSEWVPGDGWHVVQCNAQRDWLLLPQNPAGGMPLADLVARSDAPAILLETSIAERLSPGLGGAVSEAAWNALMSEAYAELRPRAEFRALAGGVPAAAVAMTVRRGDLLMYNPESNQPMGDLRAWAVALSRRGPVAVFSDEAEAAAEVAAAITAAGGRCIDYQALRRPGLPDHLRAFVDFLYIARCPVITGTPGSSFAFEAARFGNRTYVDNLDPGFVTEPPAGAGQAVLPRLAGHSAADIFHQHFEALRQQPVRLLQIGGDAPRDALLRMWRDYFARGDIRVFEGLPEDATALARLADDTGGRGFDIIVDDGQGRSADVAATSFTAMFPLVAEDGWYVTGGGGAAFFKDLVDGLNAPAGAAPGRGLHVAALHVHPGMIFVRKGRGGAQG
jgi:hypothetical protein